MKFRWHASGRYTGLLVILTLLALVVLIVALAVAGAPPSARPAFP
ncbi:hypothetical protein SCATT_05340 [Streptantibioticus cattleyicolor NRRL 8057 = DSM 46488]|uniref:Uncharacterized protein n=1 Tax=Streptantibioticus cattleyicolor (strain ATCC 35852 / DSM 46488 / JCM 4925 / NBRC 14057 / NRRL 8057) TaxID=1003195 RepID=F8JRZ4_STREN|nr:hypothetical protein SCATT_05340 [Streptantibioticus cattleyicolor NRRL 8057 = DSM 46488]CCB73262.1 exported protein of unknown function [Streptantibioticus cattleyicolor NRRL 8057 = DSM 46488]